MRPRDPPIYLADPMGKTAPAEKRCELLLAPVMPCLGYGQKTWSPRTYETAALRM